MEPTATRLWKRLTREERLAAANAFWREPPQEAVPVALSAIVRARKMRPQSVRSLGRDELARALAMLIEPGEAVAASLIVALHLGERKTLLAAFLDAVGIPHEGGILKEEGAQPPVAEAVARRGVTALAANFQRHEVETYLNALWLQDPERWAALARAEEWMSPQTGDKPPQTGGTPAQR